LSKDQRLEEGVKDRGKSRTGDQYTSWYCWNLILMIHLWNHIIGALSHKHIQEFYMLKTSQREWLWMRIVIFI